MSISAALVKELRERTGSGMMECKKALTETNGDIEAAVELMRKQGLAKADKKAGRTAAEGVVIARQSDDGKIAAMVEVNCETDFVAKGDDFQGFAVAVADLVLGSDFADLDALLAAPLADGKSVDQVRRELVAKIGENIAVRRFARFATTAGRLSTYLHGSRIGVMVELSGGSDDLAKDVAMHVAASKPVCVSAEQVPAELVAKEREIFAAQAAESGKPADIVAKMVEGRIRKFLGEVTLLGQPFVKDPDQTVEKLLKAAAASVRAFERFELGEGIEKKVENFAEEVMAQVRGS
ncbi:translation elongation factor Ts (EF-Ts) [Plasticicumulans lactativorans]|uniref:Elongation factor Ts n=1 Tax=Plasticicumulans lactativorans TaxID=1133106 RepID=A0A4R2LUW3_9GAMM|nr:translation elongation factor Ts [Plasticicumulans lactativorans]TCO83710.1 translation elongation factor Ts (EF-Ts) [Plasticicumulans lactativorans]